MKKTIAALITGFMLFTSFTGCSSVTPMSDSIHALQKNPNWKGRRGPVVLVIMDGVGYGKYEEGDAVKASKMKYLDWFTANCPHTQLKAHGTAVGLPSDDDMGNSEVGHNAMG